MQQIECPSGGSAEEPPGTAETVRPDFGRLVAMARDRSPEARRAVAGAVGGLYVDSDARLTARERAIVLEILSSVLHDGERTLRRALAERLAQERDVPRELILALAGDEIEVARPVLMGSDLLDDSDLIDLVRRHATAHQLAIAARRVVNPPVGDALVATGDAAVAEVLVKNPGARLSARAISLLADAAQRCAALGEPLLERPELTPDLAARLYWVISLELRRTLLKRFPVPRDQLDRALQVTVQRLVDGTRRGVGADHESLADRLHDSGSISPAVLLQVLRVGRFELFGLLFGRLSGLPGDTVARMIAQPTGEPLAACCRALGIDKGHFASIFLLARGARPGEQVVDPRELSRTLGFFDRLTQNQARGILDSWRRDPSRIALFRRPDA